MPEEICLLGGTGFLGRELYAQIRGDARFDGVRAVLVDVRSPDFPLGAGDRFFRPDELSVGTLAAVDTCVNLAATIFGRETGFERQMVELLDGALAPIHKVFPFLEPSLRTWVQISSISVYAPGDGTPLVEASPRRPPSPYGLAKLASELYLETFCRGRRLLLQSLRFGDLYGGSPAPPHDTRLLPSLLRAAAAGGGVRRFGDGEARRELLHVRDAARAIALATLDPRPRAWNVASDEKASFNRFVKIIEAKSGRRIPLEEVPDAVVKDHVLDGRAFASAYGFRPAVSLASGIAEAIES